MIRLRVVIKCKVKCGGVNAACLSYIGRGEVANYCAGGDESGDRGDKGEGAGGGVGGGGGGWCEWWFVGPDYLEVVNFPGAQ